MFLKEWTKYCIAAWFLCFVAIVVHASSLLDFKVTVVDFLVLPLLTAIAFGIFKFKVTVDDPDRIDQDMAEGSADKYWPALFLDAIFIVPIFISAAVIVIAQLQSSYDAI